MVERSSEKATPKILDPHSLAFAIQETTEAMKLFGRAAEQLGPFPIEEDEEDWGDGSTEEDDYDEYADDEHDGEEYEEEGW